MALITDILINDVIIPGSLDFVVNTSALSVATTPISFPGNNLRNTGGKMVFAYGDHVIITKIKVSADFGFSLANGRTKIGLAWVNNAGSLIIPIVEMSENGSNWIVNPCGEFDFPPGGLYCKVPVDTSGGVWRLVVGSSSLTFSMLNVPAQLNGTTQNVVIGVQLNHTIPLVP